MLRIDASLLQDIGLGSLPDNEKNSLLRHIYDTLEMRVGMRLADQMSNEQLDEFERFYEAKDDAGAFKWLETNFPNYKDIVQEEFDKLKTEVASSASQILNASKQGTNINQTTNSGPTDKSSTINPGQPSNPVSSSPQTADPIDSNAPTISGQPSNPVSPNPQTADPNIDFPNEQPPVGPQN